MQQQLPIETCNPQFGRYLYPPANKMREAQQDVTWTAQEVPVGKDRSDFKKNLTAEQVRLVTVTLQIFVEIEQKVGEVWDTVASWYPHSEIEGCCAEFMRMEKAVHAFFYQKVSDTLHIDPDTVSENQRTITVLKSKLEFLKQITSNLDKNKPLSLATVAIIEQVLLFSNFAMLKSFQANGNNLIKNTVTGVDFVVQDEQLHGEFAGYLFRTVLQENSTAKVYDVSTLHEDILKLLYEVTAHEDAVIDYTFGGEEYINGTSGKDLKAFIRSRANKVLNMLGYDNHFEELDDPISEWFYKGSNSIKVHDFFAGITNQYRRAWKQEGFSRLRYIEENSFE